MKIYSCIFFIFLLPAVYLFGQDDKKVLAEIDAKLTRGETTISNILSDNRFMSLHPQVAFREIIKKHATTGKVNIITETEPGKKITVKGIIETGRGAPLNDALVYAYHTSDKGWYSDTAVHILLDEGDMRHARLFCYLKTDSNGRFEFETIQARGYPHSDLPVHIHMAVWKNDQLVTGVPGELLFDEDPRLTPGRRSGSLRDGYHIEKNSGSLANPVYFYKIKLKD